MRIGLPFLASLLLLTGCDAAKPRQENHATAIAVPRDSLENGLIEALSLDPSGSRKAESGPALIAYIEAGYLRKKPDYREGYSDYRFPVKSMQLLGHKVLLVDEEYMTEFIGCCVSEGLAVTVASVGPDLEPFANKNGCAIKGDEYLPDTITRRLPAHNWLTLSCKANDVVQ